MVVVTAVVVDPIFVCCCVKIEVGALCCPVGITRGAQGSRPSLYGLPGLVGLIVTDVWRRADSGSSSSSVSFGSGSSAGSSLGVTLMSDAWTSLQKGSRNPWLVCLSW